MKHYKVCMTLAGSDPMGGAGIQADLKTFTLLGCYAEAVVTALTVQNSRGVRRSVAVDAPLVYEQADAAMCDMPPAAVKIGIVPNAETGRALIRILDKYNPAFVVFDPVLVSSSGLPFVDKEALTLLREELMPRCTLVTPNLPEAATLLGTTVSDVVPEQAAERLSGMFYGAAVLVKGGHREGVPTDVLFDRGTLCSYAAERVVTPNSHGTGCVFSSAIAAYYANGLHLSEAVKRAKSFLTRRLQIGAGYFAGEGAGAMYLLPEETDSFG